MATTVERLLKVGTTRKPKSNDWKTVAAMAEQDGRNRMRNGFLASPDWVRQHDPDRLAPARSSNAANEGFNSSQAWQHYDSHDPKVTAKAQVIWRHNHLKGQANALREGGFVQEANALDPDVVAGKSGHANTMRNAASEHASNAAKDWLYPLSPHEMLNSTPRDRQNRGLASYASFLYRHTGSDPVPGLKEHYLDSFHRALVAHAAGDNVSGDPAVVRHLNTREDGTQITRLGSNKNTKRLFRDMGGSKMQKLLQNTLEKAQGHQIEGTGNPFWSYRGHSLGTYGSQQHGNEYHNQVSITGVGRGSNPSSIVEGRGGTNEEALHNALSAATKRVDQHHARLERRETAPPVDMRTMNNEAEALGADHAKIAMQFHNKARVTHAPGHDDIHGIECCIKPGLEERSARFFRMSGYQAQAETQPPSKREQIRASYDAHYRHGIASQFRGGHGGLPRMRRSFDPIEAAQYDRDNGEAYAKKSMDGTDTVTRLLGGGRSLAKDEDNDEGGVSPEKRADLQMRLANGWIRTKSLRELRELHAAAPSPSWKAAAKYAIDEHKATHKCIHKGQPKGCGYDDPTGPAPLHKGDTSREPRNQHGEWETEVGRAAEQNAAKKRAFILKPTGSTGTSYKLKPQRGGDLSTAVSALVRVLKADDYRDSKNNRFSSHEIKLFRNERSQYDTNPEAITIDTESGNIRITGSSTTHSRGIFSKLVKEQG